MKRRSFLKKSILAGGSLILPFAPSCSDNLFDRKLQFGGKIRGEEFKIAHLLRDKKITPSNIQKDEHIYDVVIAGGGPSGLATGWQLAKNGQSNFLVLEKEARNGGLCIGGNENELEYAAGAHYIDYPEPHHKQLIELYSDCGILQGTAPNGWPVINENFIVDEKYNLQVKGKWTHEEFPFDIANEQDEEDYEKFEELMLQWTNFRDKDNKAAVGLPFSSLSRDEEVTRLDKMNFRDYLKSQDLHSELLHKYVTDWTIDEYGTPSEHTSAWAGVQFFRSILYPHDTDQKFGTITTATGLGFFSDKLSSYIPAKCFRNNSYVVSIEQKGNLVETVFYNIQTKTFHQVQSQQLVFALPKFQAPYLIRNLDKERIAAFQKFEYAPWVVAVVHLNKCPKFEGDPIAWDNAIYKSWTLGFVDNQHLKRKFMDPKAPTTWSVYGCLAHQTKKQRHELLTYDWDYWARTFLHELEKGFPKIEKEITKIDIWKWGHPMRQCTPGSVFGAERQLMLQPFGNIHFSQADVCAIPVFEEAVCRGMDVAEELLKKMKSD